MKDELPDLYPPATKSKKIYELLLQGCEKKPQFPVRRRSVFHSNQKLRMVQRYNISTCSGLLLPSGISALPYSPRFLSTGQALHYNATVREFILAVLINMYMTSL